MSTPVPPDRIRAHLRRRGTVSADVHAVADTAWDLLGTGLLNLPLPGGGNTIMRWWAVVEVAAHDLAVARLVENHLDAQAVHAEAGRPLPDGLWAVWADDTPGSDLAAEPTASGWRLAGTKRGCSGARSVTTALVTALAPDGSRLFAVPTRSTAVRFDPDSAGAVGMALSDPLHMTVDALDLPAEAEVGLGPGWYAARTGFWATAAGNAAAWYGGALGIARSLRAVVEGGQADPFALAHLGFVDALCSAMEAVLHRTATVIDAGDGVRARTAAWQARAVVEHLATATVREAGQVLGGEVLSADQVLARRVADLTVALRSHGGEHESSALGTDVLGAGRLT